MPILGRTRILFDSSPLTLGYRLSVILLIIATALPASGAVRRRLNVNSNPPGALVYVDNQEIGTTPCSVDFTYYGTREIRLIKPGYETLTVNQPIPTPWYEYIPLDFVSENLVTMKIRDNRTVTYNLSPQLVVPTPDLLNRANQLRQDTLQYPGAAVGLNLPLGPVQGPLITPAPSVVVPPPTSMEALPGVNPPAFSQPAGPPVLLPRP